MNDGSQFIDIILFAMVAIFLGLRLRSVLGRRTGAERPPMTSGFNRPAAKPADNVVDMANRRAPAPAASSLPSGLAEIAAVDPSFSWEGFQKGAAAAFEMILRAFTQGDEASLRPLLADAVFQNFTQAIRARAEAGEVSLSELVRLESAELVEAGMNGRTASVTMRFVSQQVIVIKDAEGRVVEGDPSQPVQITDVWTFARDTRSRSPNWVLAATRSSQEE